jgi:hypothetical protein
MTISRFTPDKPQHDRFITTGFFALSALTGFVARSLNVRRNGTNAGLPAVQIEIHSEIDRDLNARNQEEGSMDLEQGSSRRAIEQYGLTKGETVASLFKPETPSAEQFFDQRHRETLLEGERRLMLAILEDAVHCFQDYHSAPCGRSKRVFDEARRWIFERCPDWIFGFESICGVLEFDPAYIRKGLARWSEK